MHKDQTAQTQKAPSPEAHWAERNIGKAWQYRFFYTMLRRFGKRPAYHIMYIVTFWYALFYTKIRNRTRPYLDHRLPGRRSWWKKWWDSYQLIRHFGMTLIDMATARVLGPQAVQASCPDHDRFAKLVESSNGFVLLNAHLGCWQVGLSSLGYINKRIALAMIPDDRVSPSIEKHNGYIIDPRQGFPAVMEMTHAMMNGDVVSVMADRAYGSSSNAVSVELFGDKVSLPLLPYRLASATGCPIVFMAAPKTGFKTYQVIMLDQFTVPQGLGKSKSSYRPYAQRVADAIERFCKEHPMQFFNFYDLWADPSADTQSE